MCHLSGKQAQRHNLQPGQRRAQTVMRADTEREVLARLAVDVENIAIRRELAVVAVGGEAAVGDQAKP